MKCKRGDAGLFLADPYPYPVRGCVMRMKPLTQRARGCEGHDWKIVGLFFHILNRPKNPLVPNAPGELRPTGTESRTTTKAALWAVSSSGLLAAGQYVPYPSVKKSESIFLTS